MFKLFRLDKSEKIVLTIGVLVIFIVAALGIAKDRFVKKEAYVPVKTAAIQTENKEETGNKELTLKQTSFSFEIGKTLDEKPSTYFDNTTEELKNVKLDLSNVDTNVAGTYDVRAIDGKKELTFKIVISENIKPTFTVAHASVIFYLEKNSTMKEVIDYANVVAKDGAGNDISASIKGWPTEIPTTAQTVTYKLTATDKNGATATTNVVVQYIIRAA